MKPLLALTVGKKFLRHRKLAVIIALFVLLQNMWMVRFLETEQVNANEQCIRRVMK